VTERNTRLPDRREDRRAPVDFTRFACSAQESAGVLKESRKPLSVVRRIEGSNPSPSASETDASNWICGIRE